SPSWAARPPSPTSTSASTDRRATGSGDETSEEPPTFRRRNASGRLDEAVDPPMEVVERGLVAAEHQLGGGAGAQGAGDAEARGVVLVAHGGVEEVVGLLGEGALLVGDDRLAGDERLHRARLVRRRAREEQRHQRGV